MDLDPKENLRKCGQCGKTVLSDDPRRTPKTVEEALRESAQRTGDPAIKAWLLALLNGTHSINGVLQSRKSYLFCDYCNDEFAEQTRIERQRAQEIAEQRRRQELLEEQRRKAFAERQRNQLPEDERLAKEKKSAARKQKRDLEKIAKILEESTKCNPTNPSSEPTK